MAGIERDADGLPTRFYPDVPARRYKGQPFKCPHCGHSGDKSYDGYCPRHDCRCECDRYRPATENAG